MVQWFGLCAFTAGTLDSVHGWKTRIPQPCSEAKTNNKKQVLRNTCYVYTILADLRNSMISRNRVDTFMEERDILK